jgi:hypothetical protein
LNRLCFCGSELKEMMTFGSFLTEMGYWHLQGFEFGLKEE